MPAAMSPTTSADGGGNINPLFKDFQFPPYDEIRPDHICPGITALLNQLEPKLELLESVVKEEQTWEKLVEPLEKIIDQLGLVWGALSHLQMVKNTPQLRAAIQKIEPAVVAFRLKLDGSKPVYDAFRAIRDSPTTWDALSDSQKRVVELRIWLGVVSGIGLEGDERERFVEIEQEMNHLSKRFKENMLDSTNNFEKEIIDMKDIEGLTATALGLAAQRAISKGYENATAENGPWVLTLDAQSYESVMQHAKNRNLREEVYRAHKSRASTGEFDNTPIIEKMLSLRLEKAKLLGFSNYAEVCMKNKMATVDKARQFLENLRAVSWDRAVQEMEDLKQFAKSQGAPEADSLEQWDRLFWSERLRESKFNIHEGDIRPYFSFPNVMDGLFKLVKRLFGIKFEAADGLCQVWDKEVKFYCVKDSLGSTVGFCYFDPYSRPSEKQEGAWNVSFVFRSRAMSPDGMSPRLPVATVGTNLMPPMDNKPSLLTFEDVKIVFHEFGHALQHILVREDEGLISSLRGIEHDAWEIPSQFMENWCYHRETLMSITKHYESGETLPEIMYEKLVEARTFGAGTQFLLKLGVSSLDLELHANYAPGGSETVIDVERRIMGRHQVFPLLSYTRYICFFFHIFAGGYEAGCYGYQWAEVFSADAFSAFEGVGFDNEKAIEETGKRFRETILGFGGGKTASQVYLEFRGREPSLEALIRHNGLLVVEGSTDFA
ncbi:OLC1v1016477C1 [Oldenlandia corymbosa var. corymbosa]|uniref:oligopeptidase A n=1 Tax=Oldenlandia corymbosa var. corymbosa TaxID=529605 RepID=A0AAV1E5G3_OLDCO|nr:OLC1v1016477C1 [Oldenlandia corymbosa var. corymbosa]